MYLRYHYHHLFKEVQFLGYQISKPWLCLLLEAVTRRCSVKKVFLEISKNTYSYRTPAVAASILFRIMHERQTVFKLTFTPRICLTFLKTSGGREISLKLKIFHIFIKGISLFAITPLNGLVLQPADTLSLETSIFFCLFYFWKIQ